MGNQITSCGQKKGHELNYQFDSRPLKVKNSPNFLKCRYCATYYWKVFNEGYNFASDLTSIGGLHIKLWASKVVGVLGQNDIWVLVSWPNTLYTIRGKVVASPKFGSWWILWVCVCSWFVRALKVLQFCINNLLFGLCRFAWIIDLLVACPSPILELHHTSLPMKCCELRSAP